MKKYMASLMGVLLTSFGLAQQKTVSQDLIVEVSKNIAVASSFVYAENPDFKIDSLCLVTANKAVRVLSSAQHTADLGLKLSAETKDQTALKVFSFGYDCGGTRRWITQPVLQWRNDKGKIFAYNFAKDINCDFNEIYQLKSATRKLYLLIGQEGGDGQCYQSIAYVIEIKGDYLIVDQALFANRPYLNFCNMEYDFDEKTQILRGLLPTATVRRNLQHSINEQGIFSKSLQGNEELTRLIGEGYDSEPNVFALKFNGHKFIKTK